MFHKMRERARLQSARGAEATDTKLESGLLYSQFYVSKKTKELAIVGVKDTHCPCECSMTVQRHPKLQCRR